MTDGLTEVQRETIIPRHYRVAGYKNENFQMKNSGSFHISALNIVCGYLLELPWRGGSNEYPQSMFLSRNKKLMYTPVNPSFTVQMWGFRGSKLYRSIFVLSCLVTILFEFFLNSFGANFQMTFVICFFI